MSFTFDEIFEHNDPVAALPSERSERALTFRNGLIAEATGSSIDGAVYRLLRAEFMADPATSKLLPKFVKTCADSGDFWQFIKYEFSTYRERRDYLRSEFDALINYLEKNYAPATEGISGVLETFDMEGVGGAWRKALERVSGDPEGAITAARTLIETVCKHVLDEGVEPGTKYANVDDLPKLYNLVAKELNLAPSQHTEGVFKQILGGCTAVIEGLGALRNRVGDAHGQGKRPVRVNARHATLAVNLAGATATFIIETFNARNAR